MCKVTINNFPYVSSKRLDLIESVAKYCLKDLKLPKVTITVEYAKEMQDSDGLCIGKSFIEIVNKKDTNELIDTIAHEIRHCYQNFYNVYNTDSKVYKKYDYNTLPWEVDARKYALKVVKHFS